MPRGGDLSSTGGRVGSYPQADSPDQGDFRADPNVSGWVQDRSMERSPQPLEPLERDLDALRAAWADSLPAFGAIAGTTQVELEQMSDSGWCRSPTCWRGCAVMPRRCWPGWPPRWRDARGPSSATSGSRRRRASTTRCGSSQRRPGRPAAMRRSSSASARPRPSGRRSAASGCASKHPHVAAALQTAAIGIDAASAITSMLERVALRADPAHADVAEAALVELAPRFRSNSSCAACARPRPGSTPTVSSPEKSSCAASVRSPCARRQRNGSPARQARPRVGRADQGGDRGTRERRAAPA